MFLERCLPCCLSHVGVLCGLRNKALGRYDFRCFLIRPSLLIIELTWLELWGAPAVGHLILTLPVLLMILWRSWRGGCVQRAFERGASMLSRLALFWRFDGRCSQIKTKSALFWFWNENFFIYKSVILFFGCCMIGLSSKLQINATETHELSHNIVCCYKRCAPDLHSLMYWNAKPSFQPSSLLICPSPISFWKVRR